jgi:hypothetical protein
VASFDQLQEKVRRRVIDLPQTVQLEIPDLVNQALREAQRRHNFQVMQAQAVFTTTIEERVLGAVPTDWKENREDPWYTEALGRNRPVTWLARRQDASRLYGEDPELDFGEPQMLLEGDASDNLGTTNILVFPFPDGNSDHNDGEYRITVPYWRFLPLLAAGPDQNWLTVNGERFIVDFATSEAFFLDWDEERGTLWRQRAEERMAELRLLDKRRQIAKMSGTLSVNRQGVFAPGHRR